MQKPKDQAPTAALYHTVTVCDVVSFFLRSAGYSDFLQFMKGREPIILPRRQRYETEWAFKLRHEQWLRKQERADAGFIHIYAWLIYERNLESEAIQINMIKVDVDEKRDC